MSLRKQQEFEEEVAILRKMDTLLGDRVTRLAGDHASSCRGVKTELISGSELKHVKEGVA